MTNLKKKIIKNNNNTKFKWKDVIFQVLYRQNKTDMTSYVTQDNLIECHRTNLQYSISTAQIAHLVENLICKRKVAGSSSDLGKQFFWTLYVSNLRIRGPIPTEQVGMS